VSPLRFPAALASALLLTAPLLAGPPAVPVEKVEAPFLDVLETSITALSSSKMKLPGGGSVSQTALETNFDFTRRIGMGGPWYFALGVSYEGFYFGNTARGLPRELQGVAGIAAVQYIVQDHVAAALELRPGFYAAGDFTSKAFDLPVLLYAPIPLRKNLFAMLGARFSGLQDPPVAPIGGLIWLINDSLRLEAIFPQSKLVYSPDDHWEYVLGAEIAGDGFRMDRNPDLPEKLRGAAVLYSEYRAGLGVNYTPKRGQTVGLDAGYVFERSLDYFRDRLNLRSSGAAYVRLQGSLEF
jgi:hypothetical protein